MRQIALVAGIIALVVGGSPAIAADPSILAGTWTLNVDDSEDPREEFRMWMQRRALSGDATAAGGSPAGAGGGGGGHGHGGGHGGGGFSDDGHGGGGGFGGGAQGLMGMMQSLAAGAELLKIAFADPELTIENANGAANMVFTDGRVVETAGEDGGKTKVKTRWKKDKLSVAVTFPPYASDGTTVSPSVAMVYQIDKSGRLKVATTVGVGGRTPPFSIERIYDPVDL